MKRSFIIIFIFLSFVVSGYSQFGILDNTFSTDGLQVTQLDSSDENGLDMKIQADGKIVVAGITVTNYVFDFIITRYLPDGTPDSTFDNDGILILDMDTSHSTDVGYCLDIQSDGKIVVAGTAYVNSDADFAVCRLNPNGSLDASFDGDGIRIIPAGLIGGDNEVFAIKIDANGKIILGGYVSSASTNKNFALYRLNADGSTDTTFGNGGLTYTNFFGMDDMVNSIAILNDGRIVAAGSANIVTTTDYALAMYTGNGILDHSFSADGKVNTDFGANSDIAWEIIQQGDGKLLVAGSSRMSGDKDLSIARYHLTGSLDSTFNTNGKYTYGTGDDDEFKTLLIQPDNYIVAGGYTSTGTQKDLAMMRFDFYGNPDTSFGNNGMVITDVLSSGEDFIAGMEIQNSDLKLVVAGTAGTISPDIAVARYTTGMTIGIAEFGLDQKILIYPNPVTDLARINYTLKTDQKITLDLRDMHGRLVKNYLNNQDQAAGDHSQEILLPSDLPSGVYFVTLLAPTGSISIKILH
jgi:uncharacterized delta-60 repeat protein